MKTKANKIHEPLAPKATFKINWESVDTVMKKKREETREFLKKVQLP